MTAPMRLRVRVRPGARRPAVGGRWEGPGDASGGDGSSRPRAALLVAVAAPAVDGRANAAVCAALAAALGVRARQVRIAAGWRSRDKVIEIDDAPADLADRVATLIGG